MATIFIVKWHKVTTMLKYRRGDYSVYLLVQKYIYNMHTVMDSLTIGIHSEKCVVRQFVT